MKAPVLGVGQRVNDLLELVHNDVCGPLNRVAHDSFTYFVTFTDDKSRLGYVYLMRHKSETFEKFKIFQNEVEKQTGKFIKCLLSDRGGEYMSDEFRNYLKEYSILA